MKKLLLAIPAVLLLATSCTLPNQHNQNGITRTCADKYVQQNTSTTPVSGVFNCMSNNIQQAAHGYALTTDADLARAWGPLQGKSESRYVEQNKTGGYVYELTTTVDGKITLDVYAVVYEDTRPTITERTTVQEKGKDGKVRDVVKLKEVKNPDFNKVIAVQATQ